LSFAICQTATVLSCKEVLHNVKAKSISFTFGFHPLVLYSAVKNKSETVNYLVQTIHNSFNWGQTGGVHAELFPGTWKLQSLDYCQFVNNAEIFEQISLQTKIPVRL
jgi:hypothetical protein